MPMSFASIATALRMRSASTASVASASGSPLAGATFVKIVLQYQLRGDLVANATLLARFHTRGGERLRRSVGREAFVGQRDGHAEAAFELPRKPPPARRQSVLLAVGVRRQTDQQQRRMPFVDQLGDCREATVLAFGGDRR